MENNKENWEELDEFIDFIGQWILEDEQQPGVLNPVRIQQMNFAHKILQRMAEDGDITVSCELHSPFHSMGSICLEGEDLVFVNCKWLARAITFADSVDVYPLTNGRIRMVLAFHGIVQKIKEV